ADINGDGYIDAYAGSISAGTNNTPYLLINDGHGNFTRNQSRLPNIVTVSGSAPTTTQPDGSKIGSGQQFTGSLFMDYNNDGKPDLVLMPQNSSPNGIVLTNDGTGDFSKIAPIDLPAGLFGAGGNKIVTHSDGSTTISQLHGTVGLDTQAVDLNNDGYLDLVSIETVVDDANNVYYKGGKLQILINQQGKGFVDETASRGAPGFDATINYDSYHGTLTVFDINGDGAPDLIAVRVAPTFYEFHVFVNDGSGHFTRTTITGLPTSGFIVPLSTKPDEPIRVAAFDTVNKKLVQTVGGSVAACTLSEQVYQSSIVPNQKVSKSKDECLFNWGEKAYPGYIAPAGSVTASTALYNYRYYKQSQSYLGTSANDNHLYYLGPLTNNVLKDLGLATTWYASAGCN
ncbi:MAG TPA: VCBS repeat-containing protein, partial [Candidatus Acidoferrum sp.]|nr:VCBS repeat-containing protein [Candidatus Acidoferrum sp.]